MDAAAAAALYDDRDITSGYVASPRPNARRPMIHRCPVHANVRRPYLRCILPGQTDEPGHGLQMQRSIRRISKHALALWLLAGCAVHRGPAGFSAKETKGGGFSEKGPEKPGDNEVGSTGATGEKAAGTQSFAADIYPIFKAECSCHQDSNGAGKLRLRKGDAYTNMIDKPSHQLKKMLLVKPGSSMESYLWHKLKNTQKDVGGKGKKMPPSGLLDDKQLALIQMWIDTGAKP